MTISRRGPRRRHGFLADLPNMPLDIIQEVLGHLQPRDLLHLARTSKAFRTFLMSRSSAFLWRASRRNVEGLPDCPTHLSEPAYANLAFTSYCFVCLS
ncbi:hypothetical protein IEO21_09281 [Rhodonia placenta]|uniref:F-box domain-containing protein n=1 Tax=Rhodonia placenta TaxID=104341 RepID=A0A8H7TYD8_9APHY|nr:hypothetical protein IEO21_09281 [Postia placenta]